MYAIVLLTPSYIHSSHRQQWQAHLSHLNLEHLLLKFLASSDRTRRSRATERSDGLMLLCWIAADIRVSIVNPECILTNFALLTSFYSVSLEDCTYKKYSYRSGLNICHIHFPYLRSWCADCTWSLWLVTTTCKSFQYSQLQCNRKKRLLSRDEIPHPSLSAINTIASSFLLT